MFINETYCEINITNFVFDEEPKNFRYFLCGPLLAIVVFIGIIGNMLSLTVFCRTTNRPRIYYFLIVLAGWDLSLLCCSFILYSVPVLLYGKFYSVGPYVTIFPAFFMFSNMAHSGSIWIVVVLAVERYFALCQPLKYLTWDTEERAKILLGTVSVLAVFYHIPRYFEVRLLYCQNLSSTSDDLIQMVVPSNLRDDRTYKILKIIGGLLFFSFGPLLSLLLLTTIVSIEVGKNMKLQRSLTGSRHKKVSFKNSASRAASSGSLKRMDSKKTKEDKQNLDVMLVAVMVKFCVCHTLPTVLDVCETMMGDDWDVSRFQFLDTVIDISNILVVVNSSCNFAIYYLSSFKFRSGLKAMRRRSSDYALLKLRSISEGYGGAGNSKPFHINNTEENSPCQLV